MLRVNLTWILIVVILGYISMYTLNLFYQNKQLKQRLQNAKIRQQVAAAKAKNSVFEAEQSQIFKQEPKYEEVNTTIGIHSLNF